MKLCFLVDARSPIARNWINHFVEQGYEVQVISSYPCPPNSVPGASLYMVPIAFSRLSRIKRGGTISANALEEHKLSLISSFLIRLRHGRLSGLSAKIHWLAPLEIYRHLGRISELVEDIQPDLVHAMRIPYEGISAALAVRKVPLIISVWGNDFTLFAKGYPIIGLQTRQAMQRTDALHCDCSRDLCLAYRWGFDDSKPSVVLPGAGGIQSSDFHPGYPSRATVAIANVPPNASIVINPRGFRGYVRNDTFFRAIPLVLQECPEPVFLCSAMRDNPVAERWVTQLGISRSVRLLPSVSREQMAEFFRLAQITVSPSIHDGTPNTLLEAMACGCFPVVGDIESVREWIIHGVNGLLCDPTNPKSLAQAIVRALSDADLRHRAAEYNTKLINERAEYTKVMAKAEQFYQRVTEQAPTMRRRD